MAKIIEFYVPTSFRKKTPKWIPSEQYGKVIPFAVPQKKSALKAGITNLACHPKAVSGKKADAMVALQLQGFAD